MKKRLFIICVLVVGGVVTGCTQRVDEGVVEPGPPASIVGGRTVVAEIAPPLVLGSSEEHLTRLADLELFEVGRLLEWAPGESYSCPYNRPCPGEEEEQALRVQEARLADLVAIADDVRETEALPEVALESATEHLAALSRLSIVEVGALIVDEPASSPECYNLPCPSDIEAADQSNARRAAELAAIVEAARDL